MSKFWEFIDKNPNYTCGCGEEDLAINIVYASCSLCHEQFWGGCCHDDKGITNSVVEETKNEKN